MDAAGAPRSARQARVRSDPSGLGDDARYTDPPARSDLRLAPRLPHACRQALSDQADAIQETASALVALDRRDLDAAWQLAHTPLS